MELYAMQHGVCLSKELDPDQPLSQLGCEQIEWCANGIRRLGLSFDAIVSSPKTRAWQTAGIIARILDYPEKHIARTDTLKPMAAPQALLEYLHRFEDCPRVLIVSHLPLLGEVVSRCVAANARVALNIENGGLLRLDIKDFDRPTGLLMWYLTAYQLRLLSCP